MNTGKGVAVAGMWLSWAGAVVGTAFAWGMPGAGYTMAVMVVGGVAALLATIAVA